jgi:hypothetical protein
LFIFIVCPLEPGPGHELGPEVHQLFLTLADIKIRASVLIAGLCWVL